MKKCPQVVILETVKVIRGPSDKLIAINLKGLMKQKNFLKTIIPSLTQKYDYDIVQRK